ncbi:MAG: TIGR03617 family F420-dependent LLM class oxidoreductase [Thermoflexales bacterium]|nr:TIGR03617 family F420-dependent LLM class oxidoreductase [Thermoflexales bacterium]
MTGGLRIDTGLGVATSGAVADIVARATRAEALGYDALWTSETQHDPFLPLALAAEHTQRIELGTAIAVAFARSPMSLASQAWDLQKMSAGRFVLGLGTQVKAHIERRFGMTWDHPAPRLREYVLAIRAIWRAWQTGEPLAFRGEFFKLTLMTPFFNPGPIPHPDIPIYIAGVNDHLCRVAGEVCEGFHVHPFHTPKYIAEVILPNIEAGLRAAGRSRDAITLASGVFVIVGDTPEARARSRESARQQISFYASTPTYHPVFELHGWGEQAQALGALAARGKWREMPALVSDEMLATFAEEGGWAELPAKLNRRYAGLLDRVMYYSEEGDDAQRAATIAGFRASR